MARRGYELAELVEACEQAAYLYRSIAEGEDDEVARQTGMRLEAAAAQLPIATAAPPERPAPPAERPASASATRIGALVRAADLVVALKESVAVPGGAPAFAVGADEMQALELAVQPFRAATNAARSN